MSDVRRAMADVLSDEGHTVRSRSPSGSRRNSLKPAWGQAKLPPRPASARTPSTRALSPSFCNACEDRAATRMHMLEENRRLRKAKDCLRKICRLQKAENDALVAEVERLREESTSLRDVAERMETRWAELLGKHQALTGDHDRDHRQLTEKTAEAKAFMEDLEATRSARDVAEARAESAEAEIAATQERLSHVSAEKTVLSEHVSPLLAEQEASRRELDHAHGDLVEAQRMLREEAQTAAGAQGELAGEKKLREQAEHDRIRAEAALKQDAVDKVEAELLQRRLREVEGQLREAQAEVQSLQEARATQSVQLRESATMLDRQRAQLQILQRRDLTRSFAQGVVE